MPKLSFLLLLSFFTINIVAQKTVAITPNKQAVLNSVIKHQEELIKLSDQVWASRR
jgi:aminobenzoyl-glutamate utilization protein B